MNQLFGETAYEVVFDEALRVNPCDDKVCFCDQFIGDHLFDRFFADEKVSRALPMCLKQGGC